MSENTPADATLTSRTALPDGLSTLAPGDIGEYYSLLFAPRAVRAPLTTLRAFWKEVREIPDECSDAAVARVKLAWWHEELQRMFARQPRHPLAQALAAVVAEFRLPPSAFLEVVDALGEHAAGPRYATYGELCRYAAAARGNIERLAAHIAHARHPDTPAAAAEVGARLELAALLRDTGLHARRGRCSLPEADLARFGVDAASVLAGTAGAELDALVAFAARRLQAELSEHLARLPVPDRPRLVPLLISGEIAAALLARLAARGGRILEERSALMPLRQLWIAWRTARRTRAGTA